jgi:hypothetical protein
MLAAHHVLDRHIPLWPVVANLLKKNALLNKVFTQTERLAKQEMFGCRMCGQCALPATAYACPMTCPKQLRNGPCGGVAPDGGCEVYPDRRCVWLQAYERADASDHVGDLRRLQRPIDQRKWGQSSWVNYWQGEDEDLWTDEQAINDSPPLLTKAE